MLIAAAVCPHPPLLIPAATGAPGVGDAELDRLRAACHQAVAALLTGRPDLIVVAGGAGRTAEYPPDTPGRLHDFGVPFTVGRGGQDAFHAELRYRGAPFEVSYAVASWRRAH